MAFSEFMLLSRKERRERAKQREMEVGDTLLLDVWG